MFTQTKYLIIVILLSVGLAGCDVVNESFTDGYSENPNNPTDAPADKVFVAAQVGAIQFLESHTARLASMWAQYYTGRDRQYTSLYNYTVQGGTEFDNVWELAYVRGLTNLQIAREKYQEREVVPEVQVAATKVLEGLLMGQVAALWGDVPYSEAINADENSTPAYDPQGDVYTAANTLLDEAITVLEGTATPVAEDVTTLEGDTEKWLKVAYTIKARHLMHLGNHGEALAAAQNGIDAADGSGDLLAPHGNEVDRNMNLWYNFIVQERAGYLRATGSHSASMLENGNNDKTDEQDRYDFYYIPGDAGELNANTEDGFAAIDASYPIVTYLENQSIIAEAEARSGGVTGNQNAIEALNNTRNYLNNKFGAGNYDDLTLVDFQAGGPYAGTDVLQHVYNWTYLGLIGQIEGFNFLRRIDYNIDGISPVTGNQFPQRYLYPQTERNTNSNIPESPPGLYDATPVNQ